MVELLNALWTDESGQDLAEYGLLVALIAIVAIVGVTAFGNQIGTFFTNLGGGLGLP
jgi:pilus assembly protein Flp/PilA